MSRITMFDAQILRYARTFQILSAYR